ncbi:MAG: hypothetical protein WCK09_12765 [Bacteroidota bacterium]
MKVKNIIALFFLLQPPDPLVLKEKGDISVALSSEVEKPDHLTCFRRFCLTTVPFKQSMNMDSQFTLARDGYCHRRVQYWDLI